MSGNSVKVRRLIGENPHDEVITRLKQFTSVTLARKLVKRRAEVEALCFSSDVANGKAVGIAYLMRSALDYLNSTPNHKLNTRVLRLYYGTMALAQAEMLASPSGPVDLDEIEGTTKFGHGLFTLPSRNGGFAEIQVGVLAKGFLSAWLNWLGLDVSRFPSNRAKSYQELCVRAPEFFCSLRDLFASMPEIDDLFGDVFGGPPNWLFVAYDIASNARSNSLKSAEKKKDSSYVLFIDRTGQITVQRLLNAPWPVSEIQEVSEHQGDGISFRGTVHHSESEYWWAVLPVHHSPFKNGHTLLFPTVGGQREYRTIAATTLYALSIVARYWPSMWHRIEGGDEDHYLALVHEALAVWERLLPQQFLESITGERIVTGQPGSLFA